MMSRTVTSAHTSLGSSHALSFFVVLRVLDGILDQILANAADRCLDPKLMDFQIVQKICDERLAKRQQTDSDAPSLPLPSSNSNNNNPTRSVDTTVANDTSDRKNLPLISSSNDANG